MNLLRRQDEGRTPMETQRENEKFLDSLHNKTELNIRNKNIRRWTVRREYLYFKDYKKIVMYSINQRRVELELKHEHYVWDFAFVGDRFLVSVGRDFVRVWNASDGALLISKEYEYKFGYISCIAVSSTSFLYIAVDTIRRLDIAISNSTTVQLEEVNTTTFKHEIIWPSDVCGGKIVLVFLFKKKLNVFDVSTFDVSAQIDLSPHLTEGFQLKLYRRNFDTSFPDRFIFCVADSTHSQLKILILDPTNLHFQKSFIVQNPIQSALEQHSKLREDGGFRIDAYASNIRIQYECDHYYQIFDISIDEEKLTSSYGFLTEKFIFPNCKSLCYAVIVGGKDDQLILGETRSKLQGEIVAPPNETQGKIEQFYKECIRSGKRASHFCEQLSPNLFSGSLFEFYCAHRLLMMAVQDGDVRKSIHHNGVDFKWHEAIYSASKEVKLKNPENKRELKLILKEAVEHNVIESGTQYLLAHEIMSEVREQNEKILNMGRQLFVRLIQLEASHMNLDLAFERYKNVQGMTELMGIALNIIPFLGGSVAAAVTAGTDLVDGLQLSDVIAEALQISVDLISNSPTFEQGILRCVESSLRKQEIKERVQLLVSLEKCGVTIDQLQVMLNTGIYGHEEKEEKQNEETNPFENLAENLVESSISDSGASVEVAIADELPTEYKIIPTEEDRSNHERKYSQAADSSSQTSDHSNPKADLSNIEKWKISEFEILSEDRELIRLLKTRQCSFFVAALMLLFDDEYEDEFRELQPLLFNISKSRMVSGKVLCDYENNSEEVDGMVIDLKKVYPVKNIMTKEFMNFVKK